MRFSGYVILEISMLLTVSLIAALLSAWIAANVLRAIFGEYAKRIWFARIEPAILDAFANIKRGEIPEPDIVISKGEVLNAEAPVRLQLGTVNVSIQRAEICEILVIYVRMTDDIVLRPQSRRQGDVQS